VSGCDDAGVAHHPLFANVRRSPYFDRTEAAGAVAYMAYNHMYMAMDYGRQPGAEYRALTEGVTLWDVGAERQVELTGPDALRFADLLATRDLSQLAPGGCRYTLIADENGIVICDPVVLHVEEGRVWLSHGNVDLLLWAKGVALGAGLDVAVREADVAPMQLQGPLARTVLEPLVGDALDGLAYYRLTHAEIAGVPCVVSRTGWSGGPGYEIFPLGSERALEVWDAVAAAGTPLGLLIIGPNVPRALERGISDIAWFHNLGVNALEAAERLVDLDGGDFIGRDALRAVRDAGIQRHTVGFVGPDVVLPRADGTWQLTRDGAPAGATRWVTRSPTLGRIIGIGVVDSAHADEGTRLALVAPGGDVPLEVAPLPFVPAPPGTSD
jgi:glycine cleavage system aminomethyltransferase T